MRPGPKPAVRRRNSLIEHLAATGLNSREIAEKVGLSDTTVRRYLGTPEVAARIEAIMQQITQQIIYHSAKIGEFFDGHVPTAAERLVKLTKGETEDLENPVPHSVRLQAATQILDRAPSAPSRKGEHGDQKHLHIHLPEKQFMNAQQALIDVGEFVEAEAEEECQTEEARQPAGEN